jgi:hypothetical protein
MGRIVGATARIGCRFQHQARLLDRSVQRLDTLPGLSADASEDA